MINNQFKPAVPCKRCEDPSNPIVSGGLCKRCISKSDIDPNSIPDIKPSKFDIQSQQAALQFKEPIVQSDRYQKLLDSDEFLEMIFKAANTYDKLKDTKLSRVDYLRRKIKIYMIDHV